MSNSKMPIWNEWHTRENYIQSSLQLFDVERFLLLKPKREDLKSLKPLLTSPNPLVRILVRVIIENIDSLDEVKERLSCLSRKLKALSEEGINYYGKDFIENVERVKEVLKSCDVELSLDWEVKESLRRVGSKVVLRKP